MTSARQPLEGLIIRPETPADVPAIRDLVSAAFGRSAEAQLVDALRDAGKATLSLVAEFEGPVVGHVLFSPARVEPPVISALILGPLAVQPGLQGRGIGSSLMRFAIAEVRRRGFDVIFLTGATAYYSRFGFQLASGHRVDSDAPPRAFQFIEMWEGAVGSVPLKVRHAEEFSPFM